MSAAPAPTLQDRGLGAALARLAQRQRQPLDRLALQEAAAAASAQTGDGRSQLARCAQQLQLRPPRWQAKPDQAALPLLMLDEGGPQPVWQVLHARNARGEWLADVWDEQARQWCERLVSLPAQALRFAQLSLVQPYRASRSPVLRLTLDALLAQRRVLLEASVGGLLIALLSLLTSLYSMQVYDRVIPTSATQTLLVLTLGMLMAILFEWLARRVRSHLYNDLIDNIDSQLSRAVYTRFLAVRLDQLPAGVGSLAGQLRGFETVRAFMVQLTTQFLVDAPFALVFVGVMLVIAGPLAGVPLLLLAASVCIGLWHKGQILALTQQHHGASNRRTGLLVETVEGAEIIKSTQGGWRMLGRWLSSSDESREVELHTRSLSEQAQHLAQALQQLAYVGVIASGALLVSDGRLSFGGLIACSILSGRILSPFAQLASQLVLWGQAKAALQGLDAIWKLEDDHASSDTVVLPDRLDGRFQSEAARFSWQGKPVLELANLSIAPGDKIAVLGPVGAGKTTLLRLLSGMYKPQQGRMLLDGVDLAHISKPWLAEQLGYLPQDGRLVQGSLRENLTLGLTDPGDGPLLDAARQTGLLEAVIQPHALGLAQPVFEGGIGFSGGQRQLINLTRVLLRQPRLWLLDEPTASLDRHSELRVIATLQRSLRSTDTLVLVTHKPEMLQLVNRIVVVAQGRVLLDGPRDQVLQRLQDSQASLNTPSPS